MDYSKLPTSALSSLSKKDIETIKSNPAATMEELAEKGLTQKAEKLLRGIEANVKVTVVKDPVKLIPKVTSTANTPRVVHGNSTSRNNINGVNRVRFQNNQGVIVTMDSKKAHALLKAKPKKGKIV